MNAVPHAAARRYPGQGEVPAAEDHHAVLRRGPGAAQDVLCQMLAVPVGCDGYGAVRALPQQIIERGAQRGAFAPVDLMGQHMALGIPFRGAPEVGLARRPASVVHQDDLRKARLRQRVHHPVEAVRGIQRGEHYADLPRRYARFLHKKPAPVGLYFLQNTI